MVPVIYDFGLSKSFVKDSKSVRFQWTREYFPPEQYTVVVGRKCDRFSVGLIFIEVRLIFDCQNSLKHQVSSVFYMDIVTNLNGIVTFKSPVSRVPFLSIGAQVSKKCSRVCRAETP